MLKQLISWTSGVLLVTATVSHAAVASPERPRNIVLIYADDLGYGDVGAYGATAVKTPHMDRLAMEGLRFTDGHAPSATCTPSRYAMLTGEYAWRQKGTGIARGDAGAIIQPGRTTLATILKTAGYRTGVVGKWHLGMGPGGRATDWNQEITPGPREIGFDYSYLMPATGDRVPCVYVENQRVVGLDPADPITVSFDGPIGNEPTGRENPELLKMHPSHGHNQTIINGISRIGYMAGGKAARWVDEDMADRFAEKAVAFIENEKANPFFLFFSLHDIHVPRVPHRRFVGATELGPRGDVIVEFDWCVGEILAALDRLDLADDTLVILSSDNGPVIDDGYRDNAVEKLGTHQPAGPFRGGKYSHFEAGTRVPFLLRWPKLVKPGVSDALVCQVDFPTSLGKLVGQVVTREQAPDSLDILDALLGKSATGRDHLVEHAISGISLRQGSWKYIPAHNGPRVNQNTNTETGNDPAPQLYHLSPDIGERNNLAGAEPERVKAMAALLERLRADGHSR